MAGLFVNDGFMASSSVVNCPLCSFSVGALLLIMCCVNISFAVSPSRKCAELVSGFFNQTGEPSIAFLKNRI